MSRPAKRQKLVTDEPEPDPEDVRRRRAGFLSSLASKVSPPQSSRRDPASDIPDTVPATISVKASTRIPSPFKLTKIRDLPAQDNVDTISLHDILGNPLIKEAWIFNYCFDIDWMMQFFDSDVRQMVHVKVIHGSWRREDTNKMLIDDACARWPNVQAATAYIPDQFGTHHSKMFVLFSHDDTAEVIVHTANMLEKDWTNMTQAVWRSGPLPQKESLLEEEAGPIGSGSRFKHDLLAYLEAYKRLCKDLHQKMSNYDFSSVRGALVASVPTRVDASQSQSSKSQHVWGHPQLREVVSHVNALNSWDPASQAHLVAQVSSIATLNSGWLENLVSATRPSSNGKLASQSFSIIFPTASNLASSLDGYAAGGSIHTKAQSVTHLKQIEGLHPHLCQWAEGADSRLRSGRDTAAPHIKTYIQYSAKPTKDKLEKGEVEVVWALLTSANLSMQAWGSLPRSGKAAQQAGEEGVVHIQSFEIGVLVWPELFVQRTPTKDEHQLEYAHEHERQRARMVPVFGRDMPDLKVGRTLQQRLMQTGMTVVGLRMPYDLPLTPYGPKELPWSPQSSYDKSDSKGRVWQGG